MGMETVVYGFIQGPHWPHEVANKYDVFSKHSEKQLMYMEIDRKLTEKVHHNLQALSALPEDDDTWPFLSRSMFSSSTNSIQTTYKSQIIHFGASFKQIEWAWEEWLTKFEALLSTMYWDEVRVHLISEMFTSSFDYTWEDDSKEKAIYPNHPDPVAHWRFSGEPRTFRPLLRRETT
ncbi:hypothetical protein ccbrp13_42120 [Ktedonobacteria bacterium brp13]|nr:hypothetical protein ccbrp13_42120 [Ktedonobacteria bacterium brp13]